jgi:hypothetical protein
MDVHAACSAQRAAREAGVDGAAIEAAGRKIMAADVAREARRLKAAAALEDVMRVEEAADMVEEGGRLIWVSLIAAEVAPHWDPTLGPPLAWICN